MNTDNGLQAAATRAAEAQTAKVLAVLPAERRGQRKLELRRVKHSPSLSEETNAFTADLYVDGRLFCQVSNHGTGGPDEHHPAKGVTYAAICALDAELKATRPAKICEDMVVDGKPFEYEQDLEAVCAELLAEHIEGAALRRMLKRTVAYYDPEKKAVMSYKGKPEGVERAHLITATLRRKPGVQILNNMPFAEALALYRKAR